MGELYQQLAERALERSRAEGPPDYGRQLSRPESTAGARGTAPDSAPSAPFCAVLQVIAQAGQIRPSRVQRSTGLSAESVRWLASRLQGMGAIEVDVEAVPARHGITPQRRIMYTITEQGQALVAELAGEGYPVTAGDPP